MIDLFYTLNIILMVYVIYKRYYSIIYIFQLEKYQLSRFSNWFFNNIKSKNIYIPLILSVLNLSLIWINHLKLWFIILSLITTLFYLPFTKIKEQKVKFNFTFRMKRLVLTSLITSLLLIITTYFIIHDNFNMYQMIFISMIIVNFLIYDVVFIAYFINKPIEFKIQNMFIKRARNKLLNQNIDVIGITGSYGKTSTKLILNDLISKDLFVCCTPKSFNTPMGISITINNYLKNIDQVLISEMGACQKGDIKELVDIVYPKIGILTEIGPQHLDTFFNMTNIINTKFELIEGLPNDGLAILNYDNRFIRGYKIQNKVKVVTYGISTEDVDYRAINVKYGTFGSTFEVVFPNKERHLFKTTLIGKHNVYNILAGIVVADHYKIDINKLKGYVNNIRPIDNRLQVKRYDQFTIINDAFNSNVQGFKNAIDILSHFNGKKIIITPGIIELGKEQYDINFNLGEEINKVCDFVVLVGRKQTQAIFDGLIEKGYPRENIYITNQFSEGYNHIIKTFQQDFTLLIENDLPDNYTEE